MAYTKMQIHSENMGIGTLLKRFRLTVPPNQRDYSWGARQSGERDDQVSMLFKDFAEAINDDASYFVGTVVVTGDPHSVPEIADGQQRLATSMILLAAIRDYFAINDDPVLANSVEHDFLFTVIRETREKVSRLLLNVNDREYFQKRILSRPGSDDRDVEATRPSHKLIEKAANAAAAKVGEIVAGQKPQVAVDRLNEWVEFIEQGAQIILVTAPDHLSAFTIFETQNDRGLDTSQVDLLKNHLFGLAKDRLDEAQQKWALAVGTLNMIDVPALTYLRYLTIMRYGPTLEKRVMERVKEKISTKQKAIEFLDSINEDAANFVAIFSPDHAHWNAYGTVARKHLATLLNDLKVEQIMPLVMAVASKFSVKEAQKTLRMFVCWSVRFLIVGGRGGFLDKHYSQKAFAVGQGTITTASQLVNEMVSEKILPGNGAFQAAFSSATVSRNYLARYYLRALELQAKGDKEPELIPNPSEELVNLEHILPQNPNDDWDIPDEVALGHFRRLGNLVLLQATVNSEIGNLSFAAKKEHYKASAFFLTKMVAKERKWGLEQIVDRQEKLAGLAVKTWPLH